MLMMVGEKKAFSLKDWVTPIGIIIFSKALNLIGSFHTFPCVCTKLNDLIGINSSLVTINKSPGKERV